MQTAEALRRRWEERSRADALHSQMTITSGGLVLGGMILVKMTRDKTGAPALSIDDERRVMAVLATAYGQPVGLHVLAKMRRAVELWNEGEKALALFHLAFARLPPCDDIDLALRLFVADELIEAGVEPGTLMKAQGFDPVPLDVLKFNSAQPRWPAGNGTISGEWPGGEGSVTPVAFRGGKERRRHRSGGGSNPFQGIIEWFEGFRKPKESEPAPEVKRPEEETNVEPRVEPFGSPESDLPRPGYGKEVSIPGLPDTIKGTDVSKPRARMPNYIVDLSQSEFESKLSELGWTKEPSLDRLVLNFTKGGARYSVRDFSVSTEGPTAEFFHPQGDGDIDMKLRLRKD